jgi:hypothetical protein
MGAKIVYEPETPDSYYPGYRCFEILDPDGNRIEIAKFEEI